MVLHVFRPFLEPDELFASRSDLINLAPKVINEISFSDWDKCSIN